LVLTIKCDNLTIKDLSPIIAIIAALSVNYRPCIRAIRYATDATDSYRCTYRPIIINYRQAIADQQYYSGYRGFYRSNIARTVIVSVIYEVYRWPLAPTGLR
jgi:hypothetical protein